MRKIPTIATSVLTGVLLTAQCYGGSANSIGLKFGVINDPTQVYYAAITNMAPSAVAGVPAVAQANWNLLTNTSASSNPNNSVTNGQTIVDKNGTVYPSMTVGWAGAPAMQNGFGLYGNFFPGTPDQTLMATFQDNWGSAYYGLTNIPVASLSSNGKYDLYVYCGEAVPARGGTYLLYNGGTTTASQLLGTRIFAEMATPTSYVQSPGITNNASMTGNYIVFRGLTNANVLLYANCNTAATANPQTGANGDTYPRVQVCGIQLVGELDASEPAPATSVKLDGTIGSGKLGISWLTNSGTTGSLVVMRTGRVVTAQPVDGATYNVGDNLGDDNIGAGNMVVYAGPGTNVTISGLTPAIAQYITVFAYNTSGANPNYTLANNATASVTGAAPGTLLSFANNLPSLLYTNGIAQSAVTANFAEGPVDVTTAATYTSSATSVMTVNASGLVTGVGNTVSNTASIITSWVFYGVTNRTTNAITVISPPNPILKHRYQFTSDASDSAGGANGVLQLAQIQGGQLVLDGTSSYLDLSAVQDVGTFSAVSWETWITDNGTANGGRIFDFGSGTVQYMYFDVASATALRAAYTINGANNEQQINPTVKPTAGVKTHLVVTTDPQTRRGVIYMNGVQVGVNTTFSLSPQNLNAVTQNWLGRGQGATAVNFFNGSIDEFRIWQNAMTPFQVAADYAAGPGTVPPNDLGAPTSMTVIAANNPAGVGNQQQVIVQGNFASVSGVNITTLGLATYSSSNPSVATIDVNGNVRALAVGQTTLSASYGGTTGQLTFNVVLKPITLVHRYSFAETSGTTFADSVGGAAYNATFNPGFLSTMNGGSVTLDGAGGFVSFPKGLITNSENVTIEAWLTVDPNTAATTTPKIFSIGSANALNEIDVVEVNGGTDNSASIRVYPNSATAVTATEGGDLSGIGPLHLVAVFDPNSRRIDMYYNGVWRNSSTNYTTPLSTISDVQGYLGANIPQSAFISGTFNEFRVWRGAFQRSAVAASYVAGPRAAANPVVAGTAPTSVTLRADANMIVGQRQLPHVIVQYPGLTSTVDFGGFQDQGTNLVYSSSNPSVIRVNTTSNYQVGVFTNATFEAVAPGTATLTVTVYGASGPGVSSSQPVTVSPKQTMLVHRWSFNEPAAAAGTAMGRVVKDSVGAQDGLVWGLGSALTGSQVSFNPNNGPNSGNNSLGSTNDKNCYVELPASLVSSFDAVTIEAWYTAQQSRIWNRVYDIGHYDSTKNNDQGYIYVTDKNNDSPNHTQFSGADGGETLTSSAPESDNGIPIHITVVYSGPTASGTPTLTAYTNGVMASSVAMPRNVPRGVMDVKAFLGKSMYAGDGAMVGSIDEFRIYSGALTAAQVASTQSLGVNAVPSLPPSLAMQVSGNNLVFTWQAISGFSLKSSTSLQPNSGYTTVSGTPTVQGGLNVLTIPAPSTTTFYLIGNP